MRIIGGEFKGRKFYPPADKWPTRPTTDFSKEALFNILDNRINFDEAKMLDLFGGTGNHCYEFISRGCNDATYVDKFAPAVSFVKELAQKLNIGDRIHIHRSDVKKYVANCADSFDYIFAGPPYGLRWLDSIPDLIFDRDILKLGGLFVLEHNPNHNFEDHLHFVEMRSYGQTKFSFFQELISA